MNDYEDLELNNRLRKKDSIASQPDKFKSALDFDLYQELPTWLDNLKRSVFSGTFTNSAIVNGGTYNNATLGTPDIVGGTHRAAVIGATAGTLNNVVIGTSAITGGTVNSATFGTPTIIGGTFTNKLNIATGANQSLGKGTLTSGSVTISTTAIAANSFVFLTPVTNGVNLGILSVGAIAVGTSFNVHSSNALDNDTFNWWFVN